MYAPILQNPYVKVCRCFRNVQNLYVKVCNAFLTDFINIKITFSVKISGCVCFRYLLHRSGNKDLLPY